MVSARVVEKLELEEPPGLEELPKTLYISMPGEKMLVGEVREVHQARPLGRVDHCQRHFLQLASQDSERYCHC